MKRATLILFFLIILAFLCPSQTEASLKLFVGDDEVILKHPMLMINGNFMIPLWVFEAYLGADVEVSGDTILMVFDDQTILMQVGVESAQVGGQTYKLDAAPQISEREIIVPLRFIADRRHLSLVFVQELMGLRLEKPVLKTSSSMASTLIKEIIQEVGGPFLPASEPLVIHAPEEEQDLKEIIFSGGPRSSVFLDLQSYTGYQTHLLTEPNRLVLDLYGVRGDALPQLDVDDPVLSSIRSSRFDGHTLRIVCDLKASTGYRVNPWPDGGLEIEFNYQLNALSVEDKDGRFQLHFRSSAAPPIEFVYLENPLRLVLDFQETTFMAPAFDIAVEHERVSRLRVSQHLPSVTRVVLELKNPLAPLPIEELATGFFALPLFAGTAREAQNHLASLTTTQKEPALIERQPIGDGVLSGLTVVVDPGHGGSDPGTVGFQGTFEKDVNLAICLYLGEYLTKAGAKVVYTRDKDAYVSIFERPEIAMKAKADLFISVHVNSTIVRGVARGTETLYRAKDPVSQLLARTVQDEVVKAITLIDRRIWGRDDLAVFNGSKIPAIMVEVGFLDHPDEEVLLRAPGFQQVAAQGIYNGIERFYLENKR